MTWSPLELRPGVRRQATPQQSRGGWYDTDGVRWRGGVLQPIPGWQGIPAAVIAPDLARALLSWRGNDQGKRIAIGGEASLWLYDGALADISPAGLVPFGATPVPPSGYGTGPYGAERWGTPRPAAAPGLVALRPGDAWSLDNYGQDLIALSTADGRLLRWAPGDLEAAPIAGAPTGGRCAIVTEQRTIIVAGSADDPRRIAWCSIEDPEDWTPSAVNSAGSLQLRSDGQPLAMKRVREGVLILTDSDAHLLRYVGRPYYYALDRIGAGCGGVAPMAVVGALGWCAWLGRQSFWLYDGQVKPLPCDVQDHFFRSLNRTAQYSAFGFLNSINQEIWWHWPDADAGRPNRYALWSFADGLWALGRLERTAAADGGAWTGPLMADAQGRLFEHETGLLADGASRVGSIYAETGALEVGEGERFVTLRQILPDAVEGGDVLGYRLLTAPGPGRAERSSGVYRQRAGRHQIDVRRTARTLRVRVEAIADGAWGLGRPRLDIVPGERR